MATSLASSPARSGAAIGLAVLTATSNMLSAWLNPWLLPDLLRGDTSDRGLAFVCALPPFLAAALWLLRKHHRAVVWWLAWVITLLMASFGLFLAFSVRVMGDAIRTEGLIP